MQVHRLADGGLIDRSKPLNFTFNGRAYQGYQGDTLASALLANGVSVVGRSFKYARPRGIVGHGVEESNAVIQLGRGATAVPNLRATQIELFEGLEARSVAGWPSVDFDVMALVGAFGRLMPPGFYYKTFMAPKSLWMTYEHFIRKAAGLGEAPRKRDPDCYDKLHQHCDVLVVGGGPAGLMVALEAGRRGARVMLVDEQAALGGALLAATETIDGVPAPRWVQHCLAELATLDNVQCLSRSTAFGYYDHNFVAVVERLTDHQGLGVDSVRQRLHKIRARQVVLATGAIERPLVLANNDLPGVMLASSVSTYIRRYGVAPGTKLVVMTCNDSAYQSAIDWHMAGCEVVAVVDSRDSPGGSKVERASRLGIPVLSGSAVYEVQGSKRVTGASVAPIDRSGERLTGPGALYACDVIATSGGWSPTIHLSCHTGAKPVWDDRLLGFVAGKLPDGLQVVGSAAGTYSLSACFTGAIDIAAKIASSLGFGDDNPVTQLPAVNELLEQQQQALFHIPHHKPTSRAPKQFVDQQLDVTAAAVELAAREGFESVEHVKRYTALGFGNDQGKLGNINGIAILSKALGQGMGATGTTVYRPAYTPTTFGAIAGRDVDDLFDPERCTAIHRWHEAQGAVWENVGQWKRPRYYPRGGESMLEAVNRECLAVRNSVGILDASTLGKIDVQGRDAAEFLNRIYTNGYSKLAVGKCRYGVMLKEDGMIFDDGVVACLGPNHYQLFTTTGGAAGVLAWLELWAQTEWPELDVYLTSVTDHWVTATVTGPQARKVLAAVCSGVDLSADAFPFMEWRDARVAGIDARIFRISFTGELTFEINVPAQYGRHLWEALIDAGQTYGITPYGTETMHVLRAEKGFIIVGQDTDGSMTPYDMGMAWVVNSSKPFSFLGKRSLSRSDTVRSDRKQLVGLQTSDPAVVLPEGAQIVNNPNEAIPMAMQGHVTSSYYSATLGRSIALAVVKGGHQRLGEEVYCPLADGRIVPAKIVNSVFYDPEGSRQHVE